MILIYLEDSDAKKGKIIVENKANSEKHETKSFELKEIFNYSDYLVDTMTAHIDRERQKKIKDKHISYFSLEIIVFGVYFTNHGQLALNTSFDFSVW